MRTKSAIGLLMGVAIVAWAGTTMGVSVEQAFEPPSGRGPVVRPSPRTRATVSSHG